MTAAHASAALPPRKPPKSVRAKRSKVDPARAKMMAEQVVFLLLGKACYKYADACLEAIQPEGHLGETVKLSGPRLAKKAITQRVREALKYIFATVEGRNYGVQDRFARKNVVQAGQNVRRFEIAPTGEAAANE